MGEVASPRKPFGKVSAALNVNGEVEVCAEFAARPSIENCRVGLALNASDKIKLYYGISETASALFTPNNEVEPTARRMIEILAALADNRVVDTIYWECGKDSAGIEAIGQLTMAEAGRTAFTGPSAVGMGLNDRCSLLPAVRHFQEGTLAGADWAVAAFVTDSLIADLDAVKEYSRQLAREIAAGERKFVKLIVLGVTQGLPETTPPDEMKRQLVELDDCLKGSGLKDPGGTEIDVWLHQMVDTMTDLGPAFAAAIGEVTRLRDAFLQATCKVYPSGQILDARRKTVLRDYPDGVPGRIQFSLPPKSRGFALKCPDGEFAQEIPDAALDELIF